MASPEQPIDGTSGASPEPERAGRPKADQARIDSSPLFLWAAVLVGLVIMALVAARVLGKL